MKVLGCCTSAGYLADVLLWRKQVALGIVLFGDPGTRPPYLRLPPRGSRSDRHRSLRLTIEPSHDQCRGQVLFGFGKRTSSRDSVPFGKAASATRRGRMLGDEHRVSTHWRLLAIITGPRWRQPLGDETMRMLGDQSQARGVKVGAVASVEVEPAAKCRR